MATVTERSQITLHFELAMDDGAVIDSTFERAPASFSFGDGSLLSGIERKLLGMTEGEKRTFELRPEDAFGQPNPANVQEFPRDHFADDMKLVEGMVISFADAQRSELPGVVQSISGETVIVNFNHPLAGRTLKFTAEIIAVREAFAEVNK